MAAISKQSNNNLNNIIYVSIAIPKIQIPQQCCSFVVRPITILLPSCSTWPHEITCSRIIIYVQRIKNVKIHNTKWKLREPVSCAVQKSRVPNRLYKIRAPCTIIIIIKVTHTNTHANKRARARVEVYGVAHKIGCIKYVYEMFVVVVVVRISLCARVCVSFVYMFQWNSWHVWLFAAFLL